MSPTIRQVGHFTLGAVESHLGDLLRLHGVHVEKEVAVVSPRTLGEVPHGVVDVRLDGDMETSEGCAAATLGGECRDKPNVTRRERLDS